MIVPLVKVTACGLVQDKERVLSDLQEMGCLHLIPLKLQEDLRSEGGPSSEVREALRFLLSCPQRRRQVRDPSKFDGAAIERQALDLRDRIQDLEDERDFLRGRIADLRIWGDFTFPPREELNNLRLWFYVVPHREMEKVEATDLIWEPVGRDNRFCYVVVVSEDEPEGMPVSRTRTGAKPLRELEQRLEEVELELEDLQAERAALTRWCDLFASSLFKLEDQAALREATGKTFDESPLFALQAWAPRENAEELRNYAENVALVLQVEEPGPGETPPTLLSNPPSLTAGQDLVSFYVTPNYRLWDPSVIVFFSFAIFFAMILADAGYALLMALGLLLGWKPMGRSDTGRRLRNLFATLTGAALIYGVLMGSYFGLVPPEGTLLHRFKVLEGTDFGTMMRLSILIGVAHLIIANAGDAWRWRRSAEAVAPIAWILIFLGGIAAWLGGSGTGWVADLKKAGFWAMGLGGAGVLLFSSVEGPFWKRLLLGFQGLTRLSGAFGDTLSYLRLFALGLASASLAGTFNDLAGQVNKAVPGIGMLFALLILLLGHTLNFVLSLSSGVIHGLRLNLIEFFNWSIPEEGYPFRRFARKESSSWKK
jgi:V/A-type H+-transporting ATPase subunit I